MTHQEAVTFIAGAVKINKSQSWADLGCGSGTFTRALIDLLPDGSDITAVDREQQRLNNTAVNFIKANFEKDELPLAGLDGILLANAIHYVSDKERLIKKLEKLFAGSPQFLIVEYDTERANPWVPYPLSFAELQTLFKELGYQHISKLNERRSAYRSGMMYCALIKR
jgi:trans-aconitate methyltransferase